jgi:dihydroflavonol-4-reductase
VTGGTGKVGNAVARAALAAGHEVRALVRDPGRARALLGGDVELVVGDVTDPDPAALSRAAAGCEVVFNAMGLPEQWLAEPSLFDRVNADGSANLARACAAAGVRRFVHTSTADVFDAPAGGRFDETALAATPKHTAYERSKQRAERAVLATAGGTGGGTGSGAGTGDGGMEVVFTNPAVVYGLGPAGSTSLEKGMFRPVLRGLLPVVPPGGFGVVFTEGLAQGHLLAAQLGRPGERYIFSDGHVTLMQLARAVVSSSGRGRAPLATMPLGAARAIAAAGEGLARLTRRPPPMARGQLDFMLWNAAPDATKAARELGWTPTPIETGIRRTVEAGVC